VSSPFARTHALPGGPPVRLRLARRGDAPAVRELLAGRGIDASEVEVARLLAFDPAERAVICACAPVDGRETLVGIAAIDLRPGAEVDTLVVDEARTDGLGELLVETLCRRAEGRAARVA
jgi:N-acetylglutamate synthase-like GNAT family acetyltransferase